MDLLALKTEIQTDPQSVGYAAHRTLGASSYNPTVIAALLNGASGSAAAQRARVESPQVRVVISGADWALLTPIERAYVDFLLGSEALPGRVGRLVEELVGPNGIWKASGEPRVFNSRARLVAVLMHQGSRAEELFGEGTSVQWEDVDRALKN